MNEEGKQRVQTTETGAAVRPHKHTQLDEEIGYMDRVIVRLRELSMKISPTPQDTSGIDKAETAPVALGDLLNNGPDALVDKRNTMISLIDEIDGLLF